MEQPTLPPSTADRAGDHDDDRVAGLVILWTGGAPAARVLAAEDALELGRRDGGAGKLDDGRVSRRHARIELVDGRCVVTDLGSQNGTVVDGGLIAAHTATPVHRVIRLGDTLLVPCRDLRPLERAGVRTVDGFVRGPAMQAAVAEAERAARVGTTLHVRGESGTGKEGVVQAFHRASGRAGAPVAVNCAAIPHALAERLLFGARRGAYSGAEADATGYVQEADGGSLFLDEIAELEPQVQAKLLRVLESREVLPLGASKPRKVDFAFCSATHKDLRSLVGAGSLREDLYFRIATPAITLPALRDRPEEIPALIAHELARLSRRAHVSLVEQCVLRAWPGNVRELLSEVRTAGHGADGGRVMAHHLAAHAGSAFGAPGALADEPRKRVVRDEAEWRSRIEEALRGNAGNIAAAARALGLHRTQLRRLIERHGVVLTRDDDA